MYLLDFLFYHLAYWFGKNKDKLSWSTPQQRSSYVIGLATMALIYSVTQVIHFTILKDKDDNFPKLIYLLLGLGTMWLYDFIYIKRNRYELITDKFGESEKRDSRVIISLIIVAVSILLPFFIITIFVPFGSRVKAIH